MTDTKKLRELAEAVLSSKPDFCGGNWRTHYDYEKAANPQAIIALIDELEKTKAQLAEANEVAEFYAEVGEDASTTIEVLLELAMSQRGTDKKTINLGGKLIAQRARAYLKKWKGEK